jgi:hypothetical protein
MSRRGSLVRLCAAIAVSAMWLMALDGLAAGRAAEADGAETASASDAFPTPIWWHPQVKVVGWIHGAQSTQWSIGERVLHATADPAFDSVVREGTYAVAKGTVDDRGHLWADAVSVVPDGEPIADDWLGELDDWASGAQAGPTGYRVEFRGIVREIQPRYWVVGNRLVFVTDRTSIAGQPQLDALAEIKGTLMYGDIVLANSIQVLLPDAFAEVEFEGIIESLSADAWTVNGVQVIISPVTVIDGTPQAGMMAEVKGVLQPDGSVLAEQVNVKRAGFTAHVDITGLVEHMEPAQWIVAGWTVRIDHNTFIDESRAPAEVGMSAQVRALSQQDGSLLALRIRLLRPN